MGKKTKRALIIVDLQMDFMPNGALPVAGADNIVEPINELMRTGKYDIIVATQDWHPPDHCSFKKWPVHCVAGTPGAELHPGLDQRKISAIFRKGMNKEREEYSAFCGVKKRASPVVGYVAAFFRHGYSIDGTLDVVGLALDFCVLHTAKDANQWNLTRVLESYTRLAIPANREKVLRALAKAGVEVV